MNEVTEERKTAMTKSFAIVGFVAIILFSVWLAVQVVSIIPSAFSSLASIADSVYNYEEAKPLIVSTKNSVVNAGVPFLISWEDRATEGVYAFSYTCTDGVALTVHLKSGDVVNLACDTALQLGTVSSVEIAVDSEKQRFIDVPYMVTFTESEGAVLETESQITIVNASIPTTIAVTDNEGEAVDEAEEETPEPEVAGESTDTPVTTPEPEVVEEVIYAIPTSDPNGYTDLAITYLGVGILTSNNTFVQTATIATNQTGAFQFEVRNIGTKTSDEWSYEADLPSGIDYNSQTQKPLKPNERAVITIGFEGISKTGSEIFGVTLETDSDTNTANNSFLWAAQIVQ